MAASQALKFARISNFGPCPESLAKEAGSRGEAPGGGRGAEPFALREARVKAGKSSQPCSSCRALRGRTHRFPQRRCDGRKGSLQIGHGKQAKSQPKDM